MATWIPTASVRQAFIAACTALLIFSGEASGDDQPFRISTLTARDTGLYGRFAWSSPDAEIDPQSYLAQTKNMSFCIRCVWIRSEEALNKLNLESICKDVENGLAHSPQKTTLIRIDFWGPENGKERFTGQMQDVQVYIRRLDAALKQLESVLDRVQGVSISEENIPSAGRPAVLKQLYEHCKAKYPHVRFYQWWTPNTAIPDWYEGVYLPADGWIIDTYTLCKQNYPDARYHMGADPYRRLVQKYMVTGKPLISILWASDEQPHFFDPSDPKNTTKVNMWETIDHQFQVNVDYNIPSGFYWEISRRTKSAGPQNEALATKINQNVSRLIDRARKLPEEQTADADSADNWTNVTPLAIPSVARDLVYTEDFNRSKFLDECSGTGFRDLIWSPHSLQVRGFAGRRPKVQMIYRFRNKEPMEWPVATIEGEVDPASNGIVRVALSADQGRTWPVIADNSKPATSGLVTVTSRGSVRFRKTPEVWVKVEIEGDSGTAERPVARLTGFSVRSMAGRN